MALFKAITTITWKIDSEESYDECLKKVKSQIEDVINCNPSGKEFEGFNVQVDVAEMRDRKKMEHLAEYEFHELFDHITEEHTKKEYVHEGVVYQVKMNSDRYFVFRDNPTCVSCGLEGTKLILDINYGDGNPHFNLYGEENDRLVLMTKDHVLAKSKGGKNNLDNYHTMCTICNNLKADSDLTNSQVNELRNIHRNEDKLTKKQLVKLINKTRKELSLKNKEQI